MMDDNERLCNEIRAVMTCGKALSARQIRNGLRMHDVSDGRLRFWIKYLVDKGELKQINEYNRVFYRRAT